MVSRGVTKESVGFFRMSSIPEKTSQFSFNFDEMDPQPIEHVVLQSNDVPPKKCSRCKQTFPATTEYFHRNKAKPDGLNVYCKPCRHDIAQEEVARKPDLHKKKWERELAKLPEKQEQRRARGAQNMRVHRAIRKPDAIENGMCPSCFIRPAEPGHLCDYRRDRQAEWRANNPEATRTIHKGVRDRLRKQVIDAYGGKCACCGESNPAFLSVDHINNDGAEHRRSVRHLYTWLRQNDFPKDGFQLLCFNCNCAKGIYGICPHQATSPH